MALRPFGRTEEERLDEDSMVGEGDEPFYGHDLALGDNESASAQLRAAILGPAPAALATAATSAAACGFVAFRVMRISVGLAVRP